MTIPSDYNGIITEQYLNENPNVIFVFGDNTLGKGKAGAAVLRDHPQALGFITKKFPSNHDGAFYNPVTYQVVYYQQVMNLKNTIRKNPDKTFLISKLGGNLANKFGIFEKIIEPNLKKDLSEYSNVVFLW